MATNTEKRVFEVSVNVDPKAKSGPLRANLRTVIGQAVGNEKVVVKPLNVAKPVAKKPAATAKATVKKTTRARKAA